MAASGLELATSPENIFDDVREKGRKVADLETRANA